MPTFDIKHDKIRKQQNGLFYNIIVNVNLSNALELYTQCPPQIIPRFTFWYIPGEVWQSWLGRGRGGEKITQKNEG